MAEYNVKDDVLKDRMGKTLATRKGNEFFNEKSQKLGVLEGLIIKDHQGHKLAAIDGDKVKDAQGREINIVEKIHKLIDGSGEAGLVAFWVLRLR